MTAAYSMQKAVAVWFKDLDRWDYGYFRTVRWQWPASVLAPVGTVLKRRQEEIDSLLEKVSLPIIGKITFGGEIHVTDEEDRAKYKGRLFWAKSGDLIYSKIRVKQGSLAILRPPIERLAVSAEYPTYAVDETQVISDYLALVLKSRPFLSLLDGLAHGGSTKTRIPPNEFERLQVPLPPLSLQRAIVSRWQNAQAKIRSGYDKINMLRETIESDFLRALGIQIPEQVATPKAFAVCWKDFSRWGVESNFMSQTGADLNRGKFPVVSLDSILTMVQYGTSEKANSNDDGVAVLRMNNIVDGQFDFGNLKHIQLSQSEIKNLRLEDGDLLFNRTNSKELVGKCAVFHSADEYVFASYLIRVRADLKKANPDYLAFLINSRIGRQQINTLSRRILGQANINSEELRSLQIPLPPLDIQNKLVCIVEKGFAEIAKAKADAERRTKEITAEVEGIILGTNKIEGYQNGKAC